MTEEEFLNKMEAHKGILYKVSRIYFENQKDREDLIQEIILSTWKSLPSFRGEAAFSSWLYRIALNTAIVYFKKDNKRKKHLSDSIPQYISTKTSTDMIKEEQLSEFYRAVTQLNRVEKALILQYIDGLSGKEIAVNLGLSEVNVRVKTNRVKEKIKTIIKNQNK